LPVRIFPVVALICSRSAAPALPYAIPAAFRDFSGMSAQKKGSMVGSCETR
jgi:hypothetical protein